MLGTEYTIPENTFLESLATKGDARLRPACVVTEPLNMNSHAIVHLARPTRHQDAATKSGTSASTTLKYRSVGYLRGPIMPRAIFMEYRDLERPTHFVA